MKKYFLVICISIVAIFAFAGISASAIDEKYQTVKVGIFYSSTAKDVVEISSEAGFETGYMDGSSFVAQGSLPTAAFLVKGQDGGVIIDEVFYGGTNGNFALRPINGVVSIDQKAYRGGVEFITDANGLMTVINFVNINDYVASVVGKEMSPSWHIEALKAQAVCARSYCITTWNKHASLGFNLCPTQDCQVYQGIAGESESTIRASNETKDQLLMYGDSVAEALYSSSGGGSSGYSKYVWGNDVPYLQAVVDTYDLGSDNPRAFWTVTLTKEQIKEKLEKASVDIGDIVDFKVTGADEFGRTYEVTIYGTNGTHVLKNDKTRTFFGLYSQKYTISGSGAPKEPVYVLSSTGTTNLSSGTVLSATATKSLDEFYMTNGTQSKLHSSNTTSNSDSYVLNGSGWGHGLGMSQFGAKARAEQGFSYIDILQYYYVGAYVQ